MTEPQLLQIYLGTNEWQTFEAKRVQIQPARLLETINAFANTDGGILVIGLEDASKAKGKERLFGISENLDNVSESLKLLEKEIEPPLRLWSKFELEITNRENQSDRLCVIKVQKSDDVHSLRKGDTYIRRGNQNVRVGASEIIRLKYEKGSIKFEDEVSDITDLSKLDRELLTRYRANNESHVVDIWQFMKDNGLAQSTNDKRYVTKAGALLFGANPAVGLATSCSIKISHYYGTKPTYTGDPNFVRRPFSIEGPLALQIRDAVNYFRDAVKNSPPRLVGSSFKPTLLIPEWAFQEAITNAVIHRNYFVQDDIQVRLFDDRIEIESPGSYPGHITPTNIRSERFKRNPLIARTLNRFQDPPNLDIGEGVDRIFRVMREQNLYDPIYAPPTTRPNSVLLTLINQNKIEYWDTVSNYLDDNYRITNQEARRITSITDSATMSRLLKGWVSKGLIEKVGTGFRGDVYYKKIGAEIVNPHMQGGV